MAAIGNFFQSYVVGCTAGSKIFFILMAIFIAVQGGLIWWISIRVDDYYNRLKEKGEAFSDEAIAQKASVDKIKYMGQIAIGIGGILLLIGIASMFGATMSCQ